MAYYPAPAFSFSVAVAGQATPLQMESRVDAGFQEISGLEARTEAEAVPEGGENRYVHQLPTRGSYANLVLKRGYVTVSSFLSEWAAQSVGSDLTDPVVTQTLLIFLMGMRTDADGNVSDASGPSRQPLVGWNFASARPVRWVTGPFNASENAVLTEVMEFTYAYVTRVPLNEAASMSEATKMLTDKPKSKKKTVASLRK